MNIDFNLGKKTGARTKDSAEIALEIQEFCKAMPIRIDKFLKVRKKV